jgi:hypothetical protein
VKADEMKTALAQPPRIRRPLFNRYIERDGDAFAPSKIRMDDVIPLNAIIVEIEKRQIELRNH